MKTSDTVRVGGAGMTLDQFSQEFGILIGADAVDALVFSWFDRCTCPNCGIRLKSKKQVYQTERSECCVYACTQCDETVEESMIDEEIPF